MINLIDPTGAGRALAVLSAVSTLVLLAAISSLQPAPSNQTIRGMATNYSRPRKRAQ